MNALTDQLQPLFEAISQLWSAQGPAALLRASLIVVIGLALAAWIPRRIRWAGSSARALFWLRQVTRYGIVFIAAFVALRVLGVELQVLLGAAGIVTVAVGFASQTAASNLVSSWFLLGEQPFNVGDLIRVGDVFGEVISIDALSVKVRTFDNVMIRIPNKTVLETNVINETRFPLRRVDIVLSVAHRERLGRVRDALLDVADRNPRCLVEPPPIVYFQGFGSSGVQLKYTVWTQTEHYYDVGSELVVQVENALDAAGIEISVPQVSFRVGRGTDPLPLRWQDGPAGPAP